MVNQPSKEGVKSVKNSYPQTFLEKYIYKINVKAIKSSIVDDLDSSADDDSEEEDFKENCEYSIITLQFLFVSIKFSNLPFIM